MRAEKLASLYWAHVDGAMRFAYLLTGHQQSAEDLVQDAFVRTFSRFQELRKPDAFSTYLRRTMVNLSHDRLRKMRSERAFVRTRPPEVVEEMPDLGQRDALRRVLKDLPPRQRAALILRYYEDLSERQTADVLGCSVPSVKALVARGLNSLREKAGGEPR